MALLALLLLATASACLALAEIVLSFFPLFEPLPRSFVGEQENLPHEVFAPDPATGWRMRPSLHHLRDTGEFQVTYASNAQGFRSARDFDPAEVRGKIAVTGDSFTFGQGVELEETWGGLVEAGLPDAVVYNLAMPGFGIDQMWVSVRTQALPLRPDLVIVAFIADDFSRSQTAYRPDMGMSKPLFQLVDGRVAERAAGDRPPAPARFIERHSRLLAGLRHASRLVAYRFPLGEWWGLNAAILGAIRSDCREAGVPVLFVYLPARGARAFPTLASEMRRVGAPFLDLGQPSEAPAGIHFEVDGHLNRDGHRWVSDAVLGWIRESLPELAAGRSGSRSRALR